MTDLPLSRLYHDNTSLIPETARRFVEQQTLPLEMPHPHSWLGGLEIPLKAKPIKAPLGKLLGQRESAIHFTEQALTFKSLASVLESALGSGALRSSGLPRRPYPSAGGLYPVSCFLFARSVDSLESGIYHINEDRHSLYQLNLQSAHDMNQLLRRAVLGEEWLYQASAFVVMAADLQRSVSKYGERGYRFVLLEAGHIAQNLELSAEAAKVGHLCLGGFCENELTRALGLPESHSIVYAMAFGHT
jgi:SagB-type dehydrogenase family enzyme